MNKYKSFAAIALFFTASLIARTGVIVWDEMNLREGPGTRYKRVHHFERGKYFEILGREGNWIEVNANGYRGYFYKDGIKEVKTLGIYTVRPEGVIFLWGPGERYDTLAVREGGIDVEVVWANGQYLFGQFNGSGVWFDSTAVVSVRPAQIQPDLEPPEVEEIPELPEMPEFVVPAIEAQPKPVPPSEDRIAPIIRPKEPKPRVSFGVMPYAEASWVHSKAVDPEKDLDLPIVDIGDSYRQSLFGIGLRGEVGYALDEGRRWRVLFAPKAEWSPKTYLLDVYNDDYRLREDYFAVGGQLGVSFEAAEELVFAITGGPTAIGHKMIFGLEDSTAKQTLHDKWYLAPSAGVEARYGRGPLRTVLGFEWTGWVSENTRFFVKEDGSTIPIGEDISRNSFEVFFGVQLSNQ